ncbi:MAG TPA: hypothetical protein VFG35_06570 [Actinoplanes sp.]|nr:hypothetical protein [Actinoplanes sp.]
MPSAPPEEIVARTPRRYLLPAVLALAGAVVGASATWLVRGSSTVSPEKVVGTVDWSNQQTNQFSFRPESEQSESKKPDGKEQTFYQLVADQQNYPTCLQGDTGDPVRQDQRRVSIELIHVNLGKGAKRDIAVSVDCL